MKKIMLTTAFCLTLASAAIAQGTVTFANIGGGGLNSPFRDATAGNALLAGGGFRAELLAGPDAGNLVSVATFTGSFANGYFNGGTQTINNITGNTATFVVRAWSTAGGQFATYDAALGNSATAISSAFTTQVQTNPQLTPLPLVGMPALSLVVVPEPSVIALALLGAGALFLRRRKA